uniref:Uncharacterized protein n=1 Tax=Tanacetum cinerariifolium TaxID=118510 RepID=A0A699GL29_TANCI|nr:hypothetical protein [Tanacetum cinerariifolium]
MISLAMAAHGSSNPVARRAMDELVDFSDETKIPRRMKFFKLQQISEAWHFVNLMAIGEDLSLAREINALCIGLTIVMEKRDSFVDELDLLVDRFMPEKMVEFTKESQEKDTRNLMKL